MKIFLLIFTIITSTQITFWMEENEFLNKFWDNHKIIWCINTKTYEIEQPNNKWNCFIWKNYQNILIPPK